jgi:S-adenosylmethionine-diacylglycerol 3-amino-3-carboxypropyl transferase
MSVAPTEVALNCSRPAIRYAQCWEDADVLLEALDVRPSHTCLSIASAGDNTLALLARAPARVVAIDRNPAQLACLELRVAAYRMLEHHELLELLGSQPSRRRAALYRRCRDGLSRDCRGFWDARPNEVEGGFGSAGRFERYLALFRSRVLPLVHDRASVEQLLAGGTREEREAFYGTRWDSWLWRAVFRVFFSRAVMARSGRDPACFRHAEGPVAERLLARVKHACTALDPGENPYLQWILRGRHSTAQPFALRAENFSAIRANLDRLEWHCDSLEGWLRRDGRATRIDCCNLSDVFEYMAPARYQQTLEALVAAAAPRCRLAYWNLLVPRSRPPDLAPALRSLTSHAARLHAMDKAFFYGNFVLEEVR